MQWMDVDLVNGLRRCYSYAVVILLTSAQHMCENDVLANTKAVNSHRVAVSVTVSRGTVVGVYKLHALA